MNLELLSFQAIYNIWKLLKDLIEKTDNKNVHCIYTACSSSDPIPILSSHVAQIGYGPRQCKQEKVTWIPIFSDLFQACGNKSDMNRICAFAPAV